MPVTYRSGGASSERLYQSLLDWTRKAMQLAVVATAILYAYILYGLLAGAVGQWGTLSQDQARIAQNIDTKKRPLPAVPIRSQDQARIAQNIDSAILYLNISLGVLLLTTAILYYDEEPTGYTLVACALLFYFGVPFFIDQLLGSRLQEWQNTHNVAALAILQQFKTAAIMMAVPGSILLVRDVIIRFVDGSQRSKERASAMQYGGSVKEETPVGGAMIGVMARCWQMAYCRDAIRKRCPIYIHRTRCWKERVGCMCEENVIRHAMDAIINKEIITVDKPKAAPEVPARKPDLSDVLIAGINQGLAGEPTVEMGESPAAPERTESMSRPEPPIPTDRNKVKIPYNTKLPMAAKRERCRNCVIYNEHQRLKYQFVAPLVVLAVPIVAWLELNTIQGALSRVLHTVDSAMARLSLDRNARNLGVASSLTSSSQLAEYLVIGCLLVILTTMALRFLEYCIFKLKI